MIFNRDVLFIHQGKTGGMSCAAYLLNNLPGPVYNCHRRAEHDDIKTPGQHIIPCSDIQRHCLLRAAEKHTWRLAEMTLSDFKVILVVIRHPYTIEYSLFQHLQKPLVRQRWLRNNRNPDVAAHGFAHFVRHGGYHIDGITQTDYFTVKGEVPGNVQLVRFEQLSSAFPDAVRPYLDAAERFTFPHMNQSPAGHSKQLRELTDEVKKEIYAKHRHIFDSGYYELD
jgi:hypothetical protein